MTYLEVEIQIDALLRGSPDWLMRYEPEGQPDEVDVQSAAERHGYDLARVEGDVYVLERRIRTERYDD